MRTTEEQTAERDSIRASHLRMDLFMWVLDTFRRNPYLTKKKFNIAIYPEPELRRAAMDELTSLNFRYQVSNNGNSLEVMA